MKYSTQLFFAIVAASFTLTSCGDAPDPGSPKVASAQTEAAEASAFDIAVTAKQYDADYKANEVSADEKYKGKTIKISGTVESIEKDALDNAYVTMSTGSAEDEFGMGVHCTFAEPAELKALRKGQKIVVIGKGDGMTMQIPALDECKMAK